MANSTQPNAKVLFRTANDEGRDDVETMWATHIEGDHYRLENSPFYAYGVSWEDVVAAPFSEQEGFPTFERIVAKSGNRTVRVLVDEQPAPGNESERLLRALEALGCSWEGAGNRYFSVNIPPGVDLNEVRKYLIDQRATWEHADPTYAALFPDEA